MKIVMSSKNIGEYKNEEALKIINQSLGTPIRNMVIHSVDLRVNYLDGASDVLISLKKNEEEATPSTYVQFKSLVMIDYFFDLDNSIFIDDFKLSFDKESKCYYFSIDPDSSVLGISEDDCGVSGVRSFF